MIDSPSDALKEESGAQPSPPEYPGENAPPASPLHALSLAFDDTFDLLMRPLDVRRWFWLSVVCLFLGGGTSSAAFNWSLGSLPGDIGFDQALSQMRQYVAEHVWLIILVALTGVSLALGLLFLRSVLRFALVDAILKREVFLRAAWNANRLLGRSYFVWLLTTLVLVGVALTWGALTLFPHLRSVAASGTRTASFWAMLVGLLLADVVVGLLLAVVITVTDDLVVPVMYAERLTLVRAWRRTWRALRNEPVAFALYIVVRFAVAVGIGVAALFLLFPILVGLFSGAIITGVVVVLALRLIGLAWTWNAVTSGVASVALLLLIGLVLILLGVVGMPGQILIQGFGIRFIAARVPSVRDLLPPPRTEAAIIDSQAFEEALRQSEAPGGGHL